MAMTVFALWLAASGIIPGTVTHALSATGEQTVRSSGRFKVNDKQFRLLTRKPAAPWMMRSCSGRSSRSSGWGARESSSFISGCQGPRGVVLSPVEMREVTNPGAKNVKREDEPPAKHITDADFRALSTRSNTLLLDIRDRETFGEGRDKGAVNIPFEEVLTRGPAELPVSRHIVIDCRDPLEFCAMAVHWLASSGFGQVSILRR